MNPPRTLPGRSDVNQLRHQARDLQRSAAAGDPSAVARLAAVSPEPTLSAAQLALAREYGFASWARLKEEVGRRSAGQLEERTGDIETARSGLIEPTFREVVYGHAEVRLVLRSGLGQAIVGCYVRDGQVQLGAGARVTRDGQVAYNGRVATLKRFKDDVRAVNTGCECGMRLESWPDPREGDVIEVFGREPV